MTPVVILGCGYTGQVLATRLVRRGIPVIATSRQPDQLNLPAGNALRFDADETEDVSFVPRGARLVYSIPTVSATEHLISSLAARAARLVYISTTGVYGSTEIVDHTTLPAPNSAEGHARLTAESLILSRCPDSIVLRAAAIYGPGRGVHVRMAERRFRLAGDGSNYVSRIHVEDLATHLEAALDSSLTGRWPVADEFPCTSREIAMFCAALLDVPPPGSADPSSLHHTRRATRRVDGSAVRHALGITLRYPSYREGIPASLPAQERSRE